MKCNHVTPACLAVLSTFVVSLASAQAGPADKAQDGLTQKQYDEIIVTATRIAQPVSSVMAQTYVITREQLDAAGMATLAEVLQRHAAVEVRSNGGAGQQSGVMLRGANPAHTLVLVDGQRIGSATSGSAALENIPLDLIERIEVVKGPLSSLYGADAIGGVVQIFTRAHAAPQLMVGAGLGNQSGRAFNAGFTTREDKTSLAFNMAYRSLSPRSASNEESGLYTYHPDRDPYRNLNVLAKLSHTLWQEEKLSLDFWQSRGKTHYDAGPNDDPRNEQTLTGVQFGTENHLQPWWHSLLRAGRTIDHSDIMGAYSGNFETRQKQLNWSNTFTTSAGKLVVGYEYLHEEVSSTTAYAATARKTRSYFASLAEEWGVQSLSASIRRDDSAQYGKRNTGSVSYGYKMFNNELIYISTGRGFHAPSFNDLYFPGFSNPALRPERSKNNEFGYRYTRDGVRFNLAVFENRIDDLIVYNSATSRTENIRRARIQGWEASGDWQWAGIDFRAALTAQRPKDVDTGAQLRSRAKLFGNVGASRNLGDWTVGADIAASGARYDSATPAPANRMSRYLVVGANVKYKIDKQWTIELTGSNVTDRKYELSKGYNPPGRSVFLNVRFNAL